LSFIPPMKDETFNCDERFVLHNAMKDKNFKLGCTLKQNP
jgi:hypothetical protein